MKMKNILLALVLFLIVDLETNAASPASLTIYDPGCEMEECLDVEQLRVELRKLIDFPDSFWEVNMDGKVRVSVTFDKEMNLHVVKTAGDNMFLLHHVEQSLDGKKITGFQEWIGKVFTTTVEFRSLS